MASYFIIKRADNNSELFRGENLNFEIEEEREVDEVINIAKSGKKWCDRKGAYVDFSITIYTTTDYRSLLPYNTDLIFIPDSRQPTLSYKVRIVDKYIVRNGVFKDNVIKIRSIEYEP